MIVTTGNPAVWPAGIRTPTGTDPRNATTEAAICRDVADAVAWLRARTVDRLHVNLSALQAVTDATPGTPHYVAGYGWYWYTALSLGVQPQYVLTATGMGVGRWVSDAYYALFDLVADGSVRLKKALQQHYTFAAGTCSLGSELYVGPLIAGSSELNTSHVISVSGCVVGDIVSGVFGPFLVVTPSTTNPGDRGCIKVELVSDFTNVNSSEVIRTIRVGASGGYNHVHEISFRGVVTQAGTALVRLRFTAPDDVTLYVQCRDATIFGQYRVERP
jgi:hypothetical protein